MIYSTWCSERHFPSTPGVQYAFIGRQMPRKRKKQTIWNITKQVISAYIDLANHFVTIIRSNKRQIEIFVNISVKNVCIQSTQPNFTKFRRCVAVR